MCIGRKIQWLERVRHRKEELYSRKVTFGSEDYFSYLDCNDSLADINTVKTLSVFVKPQSIKKNKRID